MKYISLVLVIAAIAAFCHFVLDKPKPAAPHHFAAEGVYFLKQYVSIPIKGGVVGWLPGQELHVVSDAAHPEDSLMLTDGERQVLVACAKLTQDIEDAMALRSSDEASQEQARALDAERVVRAAKTQHQMDLYAADDMTRVNAQQVASSRIGTYQSQLNAPTRYVGPSGYSYYGGGTTIVTSGGTGTAGGPSGGGIAAPAAPHSISPGTSSARYSGSRAQIGGSPAPHASPAFGMSTQ